MSEDLLLRMLVEGLGTAILIILGNGVVANVNLKNTTGHQGGWFLISFGYGCAVMIPALMFSAISGCHINPALTIGLALTNQFPMQEVLPYISAQFIGAMIGQLVVIGCFWPHYQQSEDAKAILGTFSTGNASDNQVSAFFNEVVATFILVFSISMIAKMHKGGLAAVGIGLLVFIIVGALGGPTGAALNPARDLGPRIIHQLVPLKHKGSSNWHYAWIPVVAPIIGSILACLLFVSIF